MVLGKGSTTATLTTEDVQHLLASAYDELLVGAGLDPAHKRVLVIIPDGTRTAPIPLMFRLLYEQFGRRVAQLDYLIALGTHPPMVQEAIDHLVGVPAVQRSGEEGYYIKTLHIDHLVGVPAAERAERYPNVRIFNHDWHNPQMLTTIGVISRAEAGELSGGLLSDDVPVTLNRLILEYDLLLICGPVFPHEVAGFSGGAKYLFPGIAGPDIINFTHWLGALVTSMRTIGIKDTPVRRVITQAAAFVTRPLLCLAMVMQGQDLHGLYIGSHTDAWSHAADLSAQLDMMVGAAMGMTSEEPITHLEWFTDLLKQAGLRPAEHLLVMTLPGSYLDRFANAQQAPSRPLQPDGGTGGRMSAPATRVFLLPAALSLTTHFPGQTGQLRSVLQRAWDEYNLELATSRTAEHPFVQLAAALSAESLDGACRLLLRMPEGWQAFVSWLEQLMEESLGKGGKGVVVFHDQTLNQSAPGYQQGGMLHVRVVTEATQAGEDQPFLLSQPSLASKEPQDRLAALAASFLGWQLSMALYGYLQHITFAGQPAVENYKARARALRTQHDPLQVASNWRPALQDGILTLLAPQRAMSPNAQLHTDPQRGDSAAATFARALQEAASTSYLDLTVNGEAQTGLLAVLDEHVHTIGNKLVGIPVKLRKAPADYHSTEQSEMDGPPSLLSLRLVARNSEASLVGSYTNTFLHAQAVSTWQAMMEAGRPCFLLVIDGSLDDAIEPLSTFFSQVEEYLHSA